MPASATTHELLCRFIVEKVFNEGQLDLLPLLLAPDVHTHDLEVFGASAAHGPETVALCLRAFRHAFPDLKVTVLDQISGGDRVATRWRMEGTQENRLMGIEATHRSICIEGIRIDRIADGRIVETWNQWDTVGMLRQLGAMPDLDRRPALAPLRAHAAA
jgi:steroid delta-isomerase-like uncharacterized protein